MKQEIKIEKIQEAQLTISQAQGFLRITTKKLQNTDNQELAEEAAQYEAELEELYDKVKQLNDSERGGGLKR